MISIIGQINRYESYFRINSNDNNEEVYNNFNLY